MSVVPMKRLIVFTHAEDGETVLEHLQELGVVHMEPLEGASGTTTVGGAEQETQRLTRLASALEGVRPAPVSRQIDTATLEDVVNEVESLLDEREHAERRIAANREAWRIMRPWGDFDPRQAALLERRGIPVIFAEVTREQWPLLRDDAPAWHVAHEEEGLLYIVFFGGGVPVTPRHLPDRGLAQLNRERDELTEEVARLNRELGRFRHFAPLLRVRLEGLRDRVALLHAGQGSLRNGPVTAFRGYFPAENQAAVERLLGDFQLAWSIAELDPDEGVPVLLRNNRFFVGFEAVLKSFSGLSYGEKDVTWMVGILFITFGALCLLDAGYGLLLLLTGVVLRMKKIEAMGRVFLLTGAATIPLGAVNGQVFGLISGRDMMLSTPPALPLAADPLACFIFSLIVGLLGMSLSYGVALWQRGWRDHALGNLILLAALMLGVMAAVTSGTTSGVLRVATACLVPAGLLAWLMYPQPIFPSRAGNVVWTLYAGLTGIIQDILSHMRLFGIALSGSILAMVVNRIGGMLPVPVTAVFAVVGHAFVYVLALLSLYIHTNRLIFLEVGGKCISGGHRFYAPLKRGSLS